MVSEFHIYLMTINLQRTFVGIINIQYFQSPDEKPKLFTFWGMKSMIMSQEHIASVYDYVSWAIMSLVKFSSWDYEGTNKN